MKKLTFHSCPESDDEEYCDFCEKPANFVISGYSVCRNCKKNIKKIEKIQIKDEESDDN